MVLYINLYNCRKEYPEVVFKLDVRGALYVSGPEKYNDRKAIHRILDVLRLDNEDLKFSESEITDHTLDGKWHTTIFIGVEMEFFLKEDAGNAPVNGKMTRTFVALHSSGFFGDRVEVYKVNSDEEARKMALEDKKCIGYDLFRKEYTEVDGKTTTGESEIYKKVVFGKVCTLMDIVDMEEDYSEDIAMNMLMRGQDKAVKTRDGRFIAWEEDAEYISE